MSDPEIQLDEHAQEFLDLLLSKEVKKASDLVNLLYTEGNMDLPSIYLNIFAQSQAKVGRLWSENKINVAQEHYCTAATQMVMSQLYPYLFNGEPKGSSFIGVCAEGNMHELPMRMVTDFFEMDGWDTHYLGASMPNEDIVKFIEDVPCDVLGISATLDEHIPNVKDLIAKCRSNFGNDCRIMVGGQAFLLHPEFLDDLGADAFAKDAIIAIEEAKQLLGEH